MNKIIHKDVCGFWIFKRYSMIVEDKFEGLTEVIVDEDTFLKFNVGDEYRHIQ